MNYELAKELKEAGFPQNDIEENLCSEDTRRPYKPTLSELIEACGDDFFALMKTSEGWAAHASQFKGTSKNFVDHRLGSTPEEALTRLWLALNKKD